MADRIDHVEEARGWLSQAERPDVPAALTSAIADIAQAYATLALVEQQRIANLIALSQATNPDGSRIAPWAVTHPVDDWSVAVNEEIREGLGL